MTDLTNFMFIKAESEREMYKSAYDVITREDMWDYLKGFRPNDSDGFMYTRDIKIRDLMNKISDVYSHSGFSMGFTMRKMHFIAKNGLEEFSKSQCTNVYA